jgi:hypothetical protein
MFSNASANISSGYHADNDPMLAPPFLKLSPAAAINEEKQRQSTLSSKANAAVAQADVTTILRRQNDRGRRKKGLFQLRQFGRVVEGAQMGDLTASNEVCAHNDTSMRYVLANLGRDPISTSSRWCNPRFRGGVRHFGWPNQVTDRYTSPAHQNCRLGKTWTQRVWANTLGNYEFSLTVFSATLSRIDGRDTVRLLTFATGLNRINSDHVFKSAHACRWCLLSRSFVLLLGA